MDYKTYKVLEYENGDKHWFKNGKLHREDGKPAIECNNGDKFWYEDSECHRENGPAVEFADGIEKYYLNDKWYSEEDYYKKLNGKIYNIKGKQVSEDTIDEALKCYNIKRWENEWNK